jgi:hypothetical protein
MTLPLGVQLALESEGFTETQIDQITTALPAATRLFALFKTLEPSLTEAKPDIATVLPVIEMVLTTLQEK